MKYILQLITAAALLGFGLPLSQTSAQDGPKFTVIINTKAKVDSFKSTDLKRIYEGKMKVASGIGKIQLLDLPSSDATRKAFSEAILGKSPSEMDRLYLKNALSGKGQPPKGLKSAAEVVAYVAKHANAIGYVPADTVLTGVKKVGLE